MKKCEGRLWCWKLGYKERDFYSRGIQPISQAAADVLCNTLFDNKNKLLRMPTLPKNLQLRFPKAIFSYISIMS